MVTALQSFKTKVALARQSSGFGTAANPTVVLPYTELGGNPAEYNIINDDGKRGVGAVDFGSYQGAGQGSVSFGGLAYPEQVGHLLYAILGAVSTAGAADPYTHDITMGDTPPFYTIEVEQGSGANLGLRHADARMSSLRLSFQRAAEALSYQSEWTSGIPTKVTAQSPALATYNVPWQGWRADLTFGAAGLDDFVTEMELTISRALQPIHSTSNDQDVADIAADALKVEGSITAVCTSLALFDTWKAHTEDSLSVVFQYGTPAAAGHKKLTLTFSQLNLANGPLEIDRGQTAVMYRVPILAIYNSTDAGPMAVELINAQASY